MDLTVILLLILILAMAGIILLLRQRSADAEERQNRRIAELTEKLDARIRESADSQSRMMNDRFENIANRILSERRDEMSRENSRQMESILQPLKSKLEEFSASVRQAYINENAQRQSLTDQIGRLMELNATIGIEARNLTSALKGDSKVQGDWGEMVLTTLLESAGLKQGVNFFTQVTTDEKGGTLYSDEGKMQRPDVIVLLPDNHKLIIDSKVSLTSYTRSTEALSDEEREMHSKAHLRSVRKHIDEISKVSYQKTVENSAEHVLMFMPVEGAYFAAMNMDPDLWKYAFDRNVVIVSPTHIFSVMQILAQLWRQEKQNRNAEQIAKLGGLLYDRFASFLNEFEAIDRQINLLSKAYDKCHGSLAVGPQSLMRRAERLRDMGAKASKKISGQNGEPESIDRN